MRRRRAWLLGALALASALPTSPASVEGQGGADRNRMSAGDSVRIRLSGRRTVAAEFTRWTTNDIVLDVNGFSSPYSVAVEEMERLDAYLQRTPRESFRHGALLGAASGIFIGAALGVVLHHTGVIDDPRAPPAEIVTDAMTWMGIGLAGGALVGGLWAGSHPGFGWIRIELPAS